MQDISDEMVKGGQIHSVAQDLSKAFDRVSHKMVAKKVKSIGMDQKVICWIEEFLKGRKQKFRIGNVVSKEVKV